MLGTFQSCMRRAGTANACLSQQLLTTIIHGDFGEEKLFIKVSIQCLQSELEIYYITHVSVVLMFFI